MSTHHTNRTQQPMQPMQPMQLLRQGRYEEALAGYNESLSTDSTNVVAWASKGVALLALKRYEEALDAFEQALVRDPDMVPHGQTKE